MALYTKAEDSVFCAMRERLVMRRVLADTPNRPVTTKPYFM